MTDNQRFNSNIIISLHFRGIFFNKSGNVIWNSIPYS